MSDLVKAPPRALAPVNSVDEAKLQVEQARVRLARQIDQLEETLQPLSKVKQAFQRHPLWWIGGAFFVGYALARLTSSEPERTLR